MGNVLEPNKESYERISQKINEGGVVVTPSDTNLALTLDPWNGEAIQRAFAIKNRPADSALTLFFSEPSEWQRYGVATDTEAIDKLVAAYWPGPLNIVLPVTEAAPQEILCGGSTVSMGCLSNPVWRGFMDIHRKPVTMTSANLSGQADGILVDMKVVLDQVGDQVDFVLRGAAQGTTKSSTIIDFSEGVPRVIRLGDISVAEISEVIGMPVVLVGGME